jgi:hypothetical protein
MAPEAGGRAEIFTRPRLEPPPPCRLLSGLNTKAIHAVYLVGEQTRRLPTRPIPIVGFRNKIASAVRLWQDPELRLEDGCRRGPVSKASPTTVSLARRKLRGIAFPSDQSICEPTSHRASQTGRHGYLTSGTASRVAPPQHQRQRGPALQLCRSGHTWRDLDQAVRIEARCSGRNVPGADLSVVDEAGVRGRR